MRAGCAAGTALILAAGCKSEASPAAGLTLMPAQTERPFYPVVDQAEKHANLARVGPEGALAEGEAVPVEGRVRDKAGNPAAGAVVHIWQANAAGHFIHGDDPNTTPLDPKFQARANMKADAEGRDGFRAMRPGAYPADPDWWRPPHIHFKVARRGQHEITTQMYF